MFSLIKGLYNSFFEKPTIKILLIGLDGGGKTTILNQLKSLAGQKSLPLDKITSTVGLNIAKIEMGDFITLFWDLGGQSILRTIWRKYYPDCHGLIYVVDGFDPSRLQEANICLKEVLQNSEVEGLPLLILINKMDKGGFQTLEEYEDALNIRNIRDRPLKTVIISALKQENLADAILWLNKSVYETYKRNL